MALQSVGTKYGVGGFPEATRWKKKHPAPIYDVDGIVNCGCTVQYSGVGRDATSSACMSVADLWRTRYWVCLTI